MSALPAKRYEWASAEITEIRQSVADVAHELAHRSLEIGDHRTATWAAEKGLHADPSLEVLWRDLITAAWQSGQTGLTRHVITRAQDYYDDLGTDMEDDTYALIDRVLHATRTNA